MSDPKHSNGAHNDLYEKVGRIGGSVEALHDRFSSVDEKLDSFISEVRGGYKEIDKRVDSLENWRSRAIGIVVGITTVIPLGVDSLVNWLKTITHHK